MPVPLQNPRGPLRIGQALGREGVGAPSAMGCRDMRGTLRLWACPFAALAPVCLRRKGCVLPAPSCFLPFSCRSIFTASTTAAPLGSFLATARLPRQDGPAGAAVHLLSRPSRVEQRRCIARVKVHRFAGVVPLKVRSPKSEWYIQAEKEFLSEREQVRRHRLE